MKKTTVIFLTAIVLMTVMFNANAFNKTNRIYADTVTVEAGEKINVPVKIENNSGFMGFALTITYDDAVFTPESVSKGSMLKNMLNDSISSATENTFKVVYTGTEDITADGTLFNIVFEVSDDVSGKHEIDISFSQPDTFNENWDDVYLNCEKIKVVVAVNGTTAATTVQTTTSPVTNHETTTKPATTSEQETTLPDETEPTEQSTTLPETETTTVPSDNTDEGKPLSVKMREWTDSLPFPLNIVLGIFVVPLAFVISLFE